MYKKLTLLTMIAWVTCLSAVVYTYYTGSFPALFNDDALYLPTLFHDIFAQKGHLKDWFLTPAPYYFPDWFLFAIAYFSAANSYASIALFIVLQSTCLLALTYQIHRQINQQTALFSSAISCCLLLYLSFESMHIDYYYYWIFAFILHSGFHYGAFLCLLATLSILIKLYDDDQNKKQQILLYTLCFFTALSDQIYIIQCILPAAGTWLFFSKNPHIAYKMLFFACLSFVGYFFFVNHQTYNMQLMLSTLYDNAKELITLCNHIFSLHPIITAYTIIFYFSASIVSIKYINRKSTAPNKKLLFVVFFTLMSAIILITAELFLHLNLGASPAILARYLIPLYALPILWGPALLLSFYTHSHKKIPLIFLTLLILCILGLTLKKIPLKKINTQRPYNTKDMACLDRAIKKYHLTHGISSYWSTKNIQFLSKNPIVLASYAPDITPLYWITSSKFFSDYYDFAIINKKYKYKKYKYKKSTLNKTLIRQLNGSGIKTVNCKKNQLLVYKKSALRTNKFLYPNTHYTWQSCKALIPRATRLCPYYYKKDTFILFAPKDPLPSGHYQIKINYHSHIVAPKKIGAWQIALTKEQGDQAATQSFIYKKHLEKSGQFIATFYIPKKNQQSQINIMYLTYAQTHLMIDHITLSRNT